MKRLVLTVFACCMMVGLFAQKVTIQDYVNGNITKDAFVEQMMDHFDQYQLSDKQETKVRSLVEKKAENYAIIADMREKDPKLFKSKMNGQRQHLIDSLRFIMDESQYRDFMMHVRSELADSKQTKKK